jgi:membrane protein DedA with SNARE-associated domain
MSLFIGLGLAPVTTDFLLISIGIFAASQSVPWYVVFPLVVVPMLLGESIVFSVGCRLTRSNTAKKFAVTRLGQYLLKSMGSAQSKELWLLRLVPCYKATLLFISAGMGLTKQTYIRRYLTISMIYSTVYFFVPFILCQFVELNVRQVLYMLMSCFAVILMASLCFQKTYLKKIPAEARIPHESFSR